MSQESATQAPHAAEPDQETPPGSSRRGLLVGAGMLGIAGVAAACGGGGGDEGDDGGQAAPGNGGAAAPEGGGKGGQLIAKVGAIPVGGGKIFKGKGVVVTQPTKGEFKAFGIKCPHRGCPVDKIEGDSISCPCHGSKFSIADGSVTDGPAKEPLEAREVKVNGKRITLV